MSDETYEGCEALVDDDRLYKAVERVRLSMPLLSADIEFATAIRPLTEPHFKNGFVIPDHRFQFLSVSPYPATRKVQREHGIKHGVTLSGWLSDWRESEKERGHFVSGSADDPVYRFVRALAVKHQTDLDNLSQIMN